MGGLAGALIGSELGAAFDTEGAGQLAYGIDESAWVTNNGPPPIDDYQQSIQIQLDVSGLGGNIFGF